MEFRENPFFTLGATMRDDRRRLLVLAEEKSLICPDEGVVRDATGTLSNPRKRLTAELGWLPGLGPKRIAEILQILDKDPRAVPLQGNLPSLARANLLADGLVAAVEKMPLREIAKWIVQLGKAEGDLEVEETITLVNEERSIAGFPAISNQENVNSELQARRRYYRQAIKEALDKLPTPSLVEVVTMAVDQATGKGSRQAPILIDDFMDSCYEVAAQEFLEKEKRNIVTLVDRVRHAAERKEDGKEIHRIVDKLEKVVKNWDTVAQPIQVSFRSRGLSHEHSHEIAGKIRTLAVELFNNHGLLDFSKRLTALQQEVFAEVDRVVERLEEDTSALNMMEIQAETWKRKITYEAEVGVMFKDKLRISPDGIQWKGKTIPLQEVTRVRWGATQNTLNGIPTSTTYKIMVGNELDSTTVQLRKEEIYSEFVDRLWKTVGVRLLTEMLEGVRGGRRYRFGTAVVTDQGVELNRPHFFAANERVFCKWNGLVIGNRAGTFFIEKKDEKKVAVELPYQEMDNVHILESALRIFWKNSSPKLSNLLDEAQ